MKRIFLVLTPVLFFSACASPTMRKWEGRKMTLCCQAGACSAEKWQETISLHCGGTAKIVGGETVEKVSGFSTQTTNLPTHPRYGVIQQQRVQAETTHEECRTYQCSEDIRGF